MEHQEATQLMAVEKYVLNELPPQLRDDFEEHYFDCQECAKDLRATTAFLDAAKIELKAASVSRLSPAVSAKRRVPWLWKPILVVPALAASLLLIAYQNVVVYPRLTEQIAQLNTPEILPSLSLVDGNSRGGQIPSITIRSAQPFLLFLDIPTQERFSSYICTVYSPSEKLTWHVQVSAQQAKDTVALHIPAIDTIGGKYSILVQGNLGPSHPGATVDLARYSFVLKSQN